MSLKEEKGQRHMYTGEGTVRTEAVTGVMRLRGRGARMLAMAGALRKDAADAPLDPSESVAQQTSGFQTASLQN